MKDTMFQDVYDIVNAYAPINYNRLVIYLEYGEASYTFAFYAKVGEKYEKCYDWTGFDEKTAWEVFSRIDSIVSPIRKENGGQLWTNMTIVVEADGKFHSDFDYTDLIECAYLYKKEWKKKYLI